ncbi:MAG TPA: hypothetical protein VGT02_08890 [Methylomirabilota bacterium]|nr:hypothetical protein [Methylomirabilota bacterium]
MTRLRLWTRLTVVAALLVASAATSAWPGRALDRLERFRALAASRLALGDLADPGNPAETYRDLYALLDDEIVESLASGGVFASSEFLQDRLDAFGEAWGGAQIRLTRLGRLVVGAFRLTEAGGGNSVRVYGSLRDEAALLATLYREGRPSVTPIAGAGEPQFLATWEGALSGRGTRPLRIDLVRAADEGVRVAWSTATLFPDGLYARAWTVRPGEVRLRYELHYPGWTPGCEGQTEQEDVYRAGQGTLTRVSRQQHNTWHRDLRAAVARLFTALADRDEPALAALVPDAPLRARLPTLEPEPACDDADVGRETVSIAATAPDRRPWSLTFRRAGPRWRLTAAAPVLQ